MPDPTIRIGDVPWGPVDALQGDAQFEDKWVETPSIIACLQQDKWIVSGAKGSGKSAIIRIINEAHRGKYFAIGFVDFNDVFFATLHQNIVSITETTGSGADSLRILSSLWQYSIVAHMISECAKRDIGTYGHLKKTLAQFTRETGGAESVNASMLGLVERIWNQIDRATKQIGEIEGRKRPANLVASGGLTSKVLRDIHEFPINDRFFRLCDEFFQLVQARGHDVTVLMDGFDRLQNGATDSGSYGVIFAALVDALRAIQRYRGLPPQISIKAAIPQDRYLSLELRDMDKISVMHSAITWDRAALRNFVGRRIELASRWEGLNFATLWGQVFPDEVRNARSGVAEDSFEYILRHTMYRPRQFQLYFLKMKDLYPGQLIDGDMIVDAVAAQTPAIAEYWHQEYAIDFPNLAVLTQGFFRKKNIISYDDLRSIIANFRKQQNLDTNGQEVNEMIDALYTTGFFGLLHRNVLPNSVRPRRYEPHASESRRYYCDFYFKFPREHVSQHLDETSEVVIHPVFNERLELITDTEIVVG